MDITEFDVNELKKKNWTIQYIFLVAVFYAFQGIYITALQVYEAHMLNEVFKLSVTTIAYVGFLTKLPNYIKFLPGLLSDRVPIFNRRRAPYIIFGCLIYIFSFITIGAIVDFNTFWILTMMGLGWGWAFVDGTLDALAVDVTPEEHMGTMGGTSWASRSIGSFVATLSIGIVVATIAWEYTLYVIGAMAVLQGFMALMIREPTEYIETKTSLKNIFKELFSHKDIWQTIVFLLLYRTPMAINAFMFTFFIKIAKYTATEVAKMMAPALIAVIISLLLGARISDKIGAKKMLIPLAVIFWMSVLTFFMVTPESSMFFDTFVYCFWGFSFGIALIPSTRISMEMSNPEISGFTYSGLGSLSNFAEIVIGSLIIGWVDAIPGITLPIPFLALMPFSLIAIWIGLRMNWWSPEKNNKL